MHGWKHGGQILYVAPYILNGKSAAGVCARDFWSVHIVGMLAEMWLLLVCLVTLGVRERISGSWHEAGVELAGL